MFYRNLPVSTTFAVGNFVLMKQSNSEICENSVGIIKGVLDSQIEVFFLGISKFKILDIESIRPTDIDKTGKPYEYKICNICHVLKKYFEDFDINQTDAQGRKTTRPSCTECRKSIDGKKISPLEKNRLQQFRPKDKSMFTCPICKKTTIVGITANIVMDHDHKNRQRPKLDLRQLQYWAG